VLEEVRTTFAEIRGELYSEPARLKLLIKKAIPEYQPYLT
jgi:hypothetical protein